MLGKKWGAMEEKNNWNSTIKTAVTLILTFAAIAGTIWGFNSYIKHCVSMTVNDPIFVKKLSSAIRPAVIFNEKVSILADQGAMDLIENIRIDPDPIPKNLEEPFKIIVTPKRHLAYQPYLTTLDALLFDIKTERGKMNDWIFTLKTEMTGNDQKDFVFRLEIIQ